MRTLKQVATNMADAFTRFGLWKGGGSGGGGNVNAQIKELWSGQQSRSGTLTLLDDYSNYDVIVSQIEPLENYPTRQSYDFMLKGGSSLTGGLCENTNHIAQYRLKDWNGTSVYFLRDTNPSGWNVTLRKIYGIKFINNLHEYSTEEKVVGKWIDGKDIYEKVIETGYLPNNSSINISIENLNIDNVIELRGMCYTDDKKNIRPITLGTNDSNAIRIDVTNNIIRIFTWSNWSTYNSFCILKYTKAE